MEPGDIIDATGKITQNKEDSFDYRDYIPKTLSAGISGAFRGVTDLAGLGLGAIEAYGKDLVLGGDNKIADSYMARGAEKLASGVDTIIGATPVDERSQSEQVASFMGELVPFIGTGGTTGLVKVGAKGATNVAKSKIKQKVATEMANIDKNLPDKIIKKKYNEALSQATKQYRDTQLRKENVASYLLPGVQISRTQRLKNHFAQQLGNVGDDVLMKHVRNQQVKEGLIQAGIMGGMIEAGHALGQEQGILADYTKDEIELNKEENNWLLNGALVAGTVLGGAKLYKYMNNDAKFAHNPATNKTSMEDLKSEGNTAIEDAISGRTKILNNISDRTAFLDDAIFKTDDEVINNNIENTATYLRGDAQKIVNRKYKDIGGDDLTLRMNLVRQNNPEALQQFNELMAIRTRLSNYIDNAIRSKHKVEGGAFDYSSMAGEDFAAFSNDPAYRRILQEYHTKKQEIAEMDPMIKQAVDDLYAGSKNVTKNLEDTLPLNGMSIDEVKYNKARYTIDGDYIYTPTVSATDKTLLQTISDSLFKGKKDKRLNDLDYQTTDNINNRDLKPFSETFLPAVFKEVSNSHHNSVKRTTLSRLSKTFDQHLDKVIKDYKDAILSDISPADKAKYSKKLEQAHMLSQSIQPLGVVKHRILATVPPTNILGEVLNQPKKIMSTQYEPISSKTSKALENAANTEVLDKTIVKFPINDQGDMMYYKVSPLFGSALEQNVHNLNFVQNAAVYTKRLAQKMTTGSLNPQFTPTSYLYGMQEVTTALPAMLKEMGKDYSVLGDAWGHLKTNLDVIKTQYARQRAKSLSEAVTDALYAGDTELAAKLGDKVSAINKRLENSVTNALLERLDETGNSVLRYNRDQYQGKYYGVSPDTKLNSEMFNHIMQTRGAKAAKQAFDFVGMLQEVVKSSTGLSGSIYLAGKTGAKSKKQLKEITQLMQKFTTDSAKMGAYEGIVGNTAGFIAKYVPYGNTMIQSVTSKLLASKSGAAVDLAKDMVNIYKNSPTATIDVLQRLAMVPESVVKNAYIQGLTLTAGVPALVAYLWNNSSQENKESYYRLSDFDKSSKLILSNFFGPGRHLYMPYDQEIGIFARITEALADGLLGFSQDNGIDPNFSYNRNIFTAMARTLNIDNLVLPELILNSQGLTASINVDPNSAGTFINSLPRNQTNLDGSKTAIQDGVFSQEANAMISTIFGALGSMLVYGTEQYNIGKRDVNITQGMKDFVQSTIQRTTRIPFSPLSDMALRATNQTSQAVKKKIDTIDQMRKLRSFAKNDGMEFGRRKEGKLANEGRLRMLSPKQQMQLQISNIAVPWYNKNIAPLYDQVSATYKQVNAYNSSGRDAEGNIISARNRFEYRQKKMAEIQDIYKNVFIKFAELERHLTNQYGRDISLDEIFK